MVGNAYHTPTYPVNTDVGANDVGGGYVLRMGSLGQRIRGARKRKKLTQADVAKHFRIHRVSVTQWESDDTRPDQDKLPELARLFDISMEELLDDNGPEMFRSRIVPVRTFDPDIPDEESRKVPLVGYVRAGATAAYYAQADNPLDWVDPIADGGKDTVAVQIQGDSLGGLFDTWLIYYDEVHSPVTPDLIGKLCVVALLDDRVVVKKITRSKKPGFFNLISNTGLEDIEGVEIAWAARVKHMTPR